MLCLLKLRMQSFKNWTEQNVYGMFLNGMPARRSSHLTIQAIQLRVACGQPAISTEYAKQCAEPDEDANKNSPEDTRPFGNPRVLCTCLPALLSEGCI